MIALDKVLIATDFSEPSDVAVRYGLEIARAFRATPILIHVVADGLTRVFGDGMVVSNPELQTEREIPSRRRLDLLVNSEDRDFLKAQTAVIASAEPADAIASYAQVSNVDLIVMGTHGHDAMYNLLVGSATKGVLKHSTRPVLLVPAPRA